MVRTENEVHVGPLERKGCAWGHAEGAGVIFLKLLALDDDLQTPTLKTVGIFRFYDFRSRKYSR